jgi:CelD/BcsL family acetyltransferase involved in cellulose biosynthesis
MKMTTMPGSPPILSVVIDDDRLLLAGGRGVADPAASVPADIEIAVTDDLGAMEADWRAFEAAADRTVFQSFDWLSKWQRHVGAPAGVRPVIVTGCDADGTCLFLLPLAIERAGLLRRLVWLGSAICDYNGPLLAQRFSARIGPAGFPALWRAILGRLRAEARFRFDYVDLSKMLETVGGQPNPFLALPVRVNASSAWVATLGDSWEAYYAAKRSGPTRKKERKQLKQLGEHGAVRFVDVAGVAERERTMETLIGQKIGAFARMGVRNPLQHEGYRAFYRDVAADPATGGLAHLSRLDVGDVPAATALGLTAGGTYYLVLSSYEDGPLARLGPGRAHLHELICHAIGHGFRRFDFTIGDEPYKRDWADVVLRPHDHIAAATLPGAVMVAAMVAFRRTKRLIKQTPALWRAYLMARSLLASRPGRAPADEGDAS